MAKNVIFRRIRGRLIPIKIKSRDISDKSPWVKTRKYEAKKNGDTVGSISIGYGRKSKSPSVDLISANVNEKFQGKGISSAIFGRIMKSLLRPRRSSSVVGRFSMKPKSRSVLSTRPSSSPRVVLVRMANRAKLSRLRKRSST